MGCQGLEITKNCVRFGAIPKRKFFYDDVNRGLIYLYHFHNYENVVVINLEEELKKGKHTIDIPSLFPDTYAAIRYMKRYNAK